MIARPTDKSAIIDLMAVFPVTGILGPRQSGKTTLARAFGISDMTVRPERLVGRDCRKDAGPCSTIQPGRW